MSLKEEKWAKFLKRVRLFRFVPFTDFVMASGSLATDTLRESSDFDVLVGVRKGRIFTNRLFSVLIFGAAGYFKRHMHERGIAKDMICLNQFITPKTYKLSPPYTDYDQAIYAGLVPVVGDEEKIRSFFSANSWMEPGRKYQRSERYLEAGRSLFKRTMESLLGGRFGDLTEKFNKRIQVNIIYQGVPKDMPPEARFICSDDELEFHLDSPQTITKWRARIGKE